MYRWLFIKNKIRINVSKIIYREQACMKNKYVLIILLSVILGVLIGNMTKGYNGMESIHISKDNITRKEIRKTIKDIKKLRKEKDDLDLEIHTFKEKYEDIDKINKVDELKKKLSYTDISGEGIYIEVDALNEEVGNIANLIDYNKILIKIVNELKLNGGEFISINKERINQYSEIALAGSHININSVPIAQPYKIECIGKLDELLKYIDKGSVYLESLKDNYPLKIEIKNLESINMAKTKVQNKLNYIEGE